MCPLRCLQHTEERPKIRVPPNAKTVFPSAENWIPGFELKVRFFPATAEARGAHVADVICEVGVHGTGFQGDVEGAEGGGWGVVVLRCGPLDAVEIFGEMGALVGEPVALLGCEVPAPVADF